MTDYKVESCQIAFIADGLTIRDMRIFIKNGGGYIFFESRNNSPWSCCYRANELSNLKLDNVFTNQKLDKLWNESINNETKKFVEKTAKEIANELTEDIRNWKSDELLQLSHRTSTMERRCEIFNRIKGYKPYGKISLEEFTKLWNEN